MHCPNCGQQQLSAELKFCSRCGFPMSQVALLVAGGGQSNVVSDHSTDISSPRKKGLKMGGVMLILGTFIVPILGVLDAGDKLIGTMALVFFLGGILRIIYALLFQSNLPAEDIFGKVLTENAKKILPGKTNAQHLPPSSIPTKDYIVPNAGNWRDTNDLSQVSVTENTTQLLSKDENS